MTENTKANHILVPKHEKISDEEKKALFERYKISVRELPKIMITDAALTGMEIQIGDVIKITRTSSTAGIAVYYRGVSND
jgi:DNA-directed RNA polymerase subunit H